MSVIIFLLCLLHGVTPDKCSTTTTEPESTTTTTTTTEPESTTTTTTTTTTETVPSTSTPQDVGPNYSVVGKFQYRDGIYNCNQGNRRILTVKSEDELEEFRRVAEHHFKTDTEIKGIWLPFTYDTRDKKIYFSDGQEGNSWIREKLENVQSLD